MAVEAELKLALPPGEHDRVARHPLLQRQALGPPREQVLHSTYYDTPDLDLLRQGVALRVRRDGERWIQTLKGGGGVSGGLHRRSEWEWPIPGAEPDYSVIDDPEAAVFLADPDLRGRIAALFVTEFRRTRWDLAPPGGGRVELALDLGEVRSSHGSAPISELELELKSGAVPGLYEIGIALARDLPLTIENRSKAQRGYAFYRNQPPPSRSAPNLALGRETPIGEAHAATLEAGLAHLQANESAILAGDGQEAVLQLRAAMEGLVSVLGLFEPLIPEHPGLLEDLEWLERRLAPVHYWIALTETGIAPLLRACPDCAGLERLAVHCAGQRDQRLEELRLALRSPRQTLLVLTLGHRIAARSWEQAAAAEMLEAPLGPRADAALERLGRQLRRRGRQVRDLKTQERRTLRLDAARLRHACHVLAGLYPEPARLHQMAALERLQESLEAVRDTDRATALLDELPAYLEEDLRPLLEENLAFHRRTWLDAAERAWRDQRGQERFWQT